MLDAGKNLRASILIVDDEPSVGDALKLILESHGYHVVLVTTGRDGVEQARNQRFGFAVVDLFLSDMCGFQVIAAIHEHQPHIPILLVTSHDSPPIFDKAKKLGAITALSKPFHPDEILTLIELSLDSATNDSA